MCEDIRQSQANWEPEKEREWGRERSSTFFGDLHLILCPARRLSSFNRACSDTHRQSQWRRTQAALHDTAHLAPSLSICLYLGAAETSIPLKNFPPSGSLSVLNSFLFFAQFIACPPWCSLDSTRQSHLSLTPVSLVSLSLSRCLSESAVSWSQADSGGVQKHHPSGSKTNTHTHSLTHPYH